MFKKTSSKLLFNLLILASLMIGLYACQQKESLNLEIEKMEKSLFESHLEDHTQKISAKDQGNGTYNIIGAQGTKIKIDNALVNAAGERVRGDVDIVLIEIYSVADMILNRKQTLADYDGQPGILESGGEVFVKVYQNGEELFADGNGEMHILLPTENTGGAKEGMELFYGEETGDQIIWKPTGEVIQVVNEETMTRNNSEHYLVIIQNVLGWVNVDVLWSAGGDDVECVEVIIDCPDLCGGERPVNTIVAMHVNSVNSAFELNFDPDTGSYKLCGREEGAIPLGGITATFIVVVECPDGRIYVAIVTVTINAGYHTEIIDCDDFREMDERTFEDVLRSL